MTDLFAEPRFLAGVREFNAANFFEAHEVWEDLWNDLIGPSKQACQGLIQIAAGYHKLSIGNPAGARKLLERGTRLLQTMLPAGAWGTDFAASVARDLGRLQRGEGQMPKALPRLTLPPR